MRLAVLTNTEPDGIRPIKITRTKQKMKKYLEIAIVALVTVIIAKQLPVVKTYL